MPAEHRHEHSVAGREFFEEGMGVVRQPGLLGIVDKRCESPVESGVDDQARSREDPGLDLGPELLIQWLAHGRVSGLTGRLRETAIDGREGDSPFLRPALSGTPAPGFRDTMLGLYRAGSAAGHHGGWLHQGISDVVEPRPARRLRPT